MKGYKPGEYVSRPERIVQRTFAKFAASAAGSASSTTRSASSPSATRPRRELSFQRAAGAVVSEARISIGESARAISRYSGAGS